MKVLGAAGCAPRLKPIFEDRPAPIFWPAPPQTPRIRYVGQLRSSADLKPRATFLGALARVFVGREEPHQLYGPRSVVCTKDGQRVWIADPGGRCLHLFDLEHREYRRIDKIGDSRLVSPVGLSLGPGDSIYVCDSDNTAVYHISGVTGAQLKPLRVSPDIGRPAAVAYDSSSDELYVVDVTAHDVKVLDRNGRVRRIIGRRGNGPGDFNFPCDVVVDADMVWVVDAGNNRVQGLKRDGSPVVAFGQAGDAPGDLALPKGIATDNDGHVYVVDGRFENIQVFDRNGRLLLVFGEEGIGPGAFWLPGGIFIDHGNRVWVCDAYNRRVQVFEYLPGGIR
ncbi:MAG: 6-bladed beta-propeller [Phycisphaerae bacterium]